MPDIRGREILGDGLGYDAVAPLPKIQVLQAQFNAGEMASAVAGDHLQVLVIGFKAIVEDPLVEIVSGKTIGRGCVCCG